MTVLPLYPLREFVAHIHGSAFRVFARTHAEAIRLAHEHVRPGDVAEVVPVDSTADYLASLVR